MNKKHITFIELAAEEDNLKRYIINRFSILVAKLRDKYKLNMELDFFYEYKDKLTKERYEHQSYVCHMQIGICSDDLSLIEAEENKQVVFNNQYISSIKFCKNNYKMLYLIDFDTIDKILKNIKNEICTLDLMQMINGAKKNKSSNSVQSFLNRFIKILIPIAIIFAVVYVISLLLG